MPMDSLTVKVGINELFRPTREHLVDEPTLGHLKNLMRLSWVKFYCQIRKRAELRHAQLVEKEGMHLFLSLSGNITPIQPNTASGRDRAHRDQYQPCSAKRSCPHVDQREPAQTEPVPRGWPRKLVPEDISPNQRLS